MNRDKVPARYLRIYDSALSGRSKKAGIHAHCIMCMGWNRAASQTCEATGCPLWPYRPGQKSKRAPMSEARRAALAEQIRRA